MKKKKMDRLARESTAALNAGMSYGKWKALHPEGLPEDAPDPVPKVQKRCVICGAPVGKGKKRYCSWDCEHAAAAIRERKAYHRRKQNADTHSAD